MSINAEEIKLAKLYEDCEQVYITREVLLQSLVNIEKFIDVSELENYLLAHGLFTSIDQLKALTNPNCSHHDQVLNLTGHASKAGRHGSFLFYVSLFESAKKGHQGHKEAVEGLSNKGNTS